MSIGKLAGLYGICTVVFFAIDFVWLSTATKRLYSPMLGDLLDPNPKLGVAAGFYLIYIVGVIVFAILPALSDGDWVGALWRGALFGFMAYATYDLTNLATLRDWPWQIAVIDMVWGTFLNGTVAVAGFFAARWLGIG